MSREWYLIVGLAKTGTTAVGMTLRNTLRVREFLMEPGELAAIENARAHQRLIIKIVFDHWRTRAEALKAFIRGMLDDHALTTITIVRDPRDEAVSRLHY